ncbi:phospholipase A1-like [Phymastichus coffea]|uniref:phospholipase A1-like n=1 Tax=Phymastichus coffea TaxID=108790 RepID=UPI00273B2FB6|nr:phospholipase A1-like [Phymastichus coffea]
MNILIITFSLYSCLIFKSGYGAGFDGQASCAWGSSDSNYRMMYRSVDEQISSFSLSGNDIKFLFYNKQRILKNEAYPIQIFINDELSLVQSGFDVKKLTKIFIHGFQSNFNKTASVLIRNAFLKSGDFNVIVVDWSRAQYWGLGHAIPSTYEAVVKKLDAIADYISRMLRLLERYGVDLSTTTIVGHSLGAHVAGLASYKVNSKIGRIVGLDPAAPLMSNKRQGERLSKDDAIQVEIIHSEIDECGLKDQLGHYDFYPNSGHRQPGCTTYTCSHARSYKFFAESLDPNSKGFYGNLCNDWTSMKEGICKGLTLLMGGLQTKSAEHGLYYVKTNHNSPYARGHL